MTRLKVAIVMGGGVSLGAFSGGALASALEQLHRYTESNGQKLEIDILSGASAGTLTLCLLLHRLALPDPPREDKFWEERIAKPQRKAWIEGIDIKALTTFEGDPPGALFSSEKQDELARTLMHWEDGRAPEPHACLANRVYLVATLMNLNGIPIVSERLRKNPALVDAAAATLFKDMRIYWCDFAGNGDHGTAFRGSLERTRGDLSRSETWQELAKTGLASGSFPVALEPRVVTRTRKEYGPIWPWKRPPAGEPSDARDPLRRKLWFKSGRETFPFTYGDGGAFNNEPLSEAMDLIRHVDGQDEDHDFERFVLYIDPNLSGTSHTEFLEWHYPTSFSGEEEVARILHHRLVSLAGSTAGAVAGQAAFMDVREADKVNQRLAWRRQLWEVLLKAVDNLPDAAAEELGRQTGTLLEEVLGDKAKASLRTDEYPTSAEEKRIGIEEERTHRNPAEAGSRGYNEAVHARDTPRNRLRRQLFAVVDQIAALRGKQEVKILAIGPLSVPSDGASDDPAQVPLAGGFLRGFGGFLHKAFREHDFQVGRRKAARVVRIALDMDAEDLDPPPRPEDADYEEAGDRFVAAVRQRVEDLVGEILEGGSVGEEVTVAAGGHHSVVDAGARDDPDAAEEASRLRRLGRRVAGAGRAVARGAARVGRGVGRPFQWGGRKVADFGRNAATLWKLNSIIISLARGRKRRLMKAFDEDLTPLLRAWFEGEVAALRQGYVRIRVDLSGGSVSEPERVETWVRYTVQSGNGEPVAGVTIEGGPHLERSNGGEPLLVLPHVAKPIRIELGEGSSFMAELRTHGYLLGRAGTPIFRTTIHPGAGDGADGQRWKVVPNVEEDSRTR